jgi:hypothetical protein
MINLLGIILGTICFSTPILLAAVVGISYRLNTMALISKMREERRYVIVDPALPKRLRLIGLVDFILFIGLSICVWIIFNKPPEPIIYFEVSIATIITITIIVMQFVFHKTEMKIIKGK